MRPCPTCGKSGTEECIRGVMYGAIWRQNIPYPKGHDSRRTVNKSVPLETPNDR